jgi:hypothetical protein
VIRPRNEIETLWVERIKVPVNDTAPRAPETALVPPTTRALPENETLSAALSEQACALRTDSRREPCAPFRVTLPPSLTHVGLVKTPAPDPFSVPLPIRRPRPDIVAPPNALLPLTYPEAVPEYEAVNVCV